MTNDDHNDDHAAPNDDQSLTIDEAARRYGVSPPTIRRRIKDRKLAAFQRPTERGFEWRVLPDQSVAKDDHNVDQIDDQPVGNVDHPNDTPPAAPAPELMKALDMVDRLQQDNQQLAGQVGFLQAQLQSAEEQIRLLSAPTDEPKPAAQSEPAGAAGAMVEEDLGMINPFDPRPRAFRAWLEELAYPLQYLLLNITEPLFRNDVRYKYDHDLPPLSEAPCFVCDNTGDCPRCDGDGRILRGAEILPCPTCRGRLVCWRCAGTRQVDVRWWRDGNRR